MKAKHRIVFTIVFISIVIAAAIGSISTSLNTDDYNMLTISRERFSPSYDKRTLSAGESGLLTYKTTFASSELVPIDSNTYTIVVNKVTDNGIRVLLNDQVILVHGDMTKGNSSLKNSVIYATIDYKLIKESNDLTIETYALYKTGIEADGIYIADESTAMEIIKQLTYYDFILVVLGIGFLTFSMFFCLILYYLSSKRDIAFIYCSLSTLFFIVYFTEYIKVPYLSYDFLTYKKITMTSLYLASFFFAIAIGRFLESKALAYISGITLIGFIIIVLVSRDMTTFKTAYNYYFVVYYINLLYAFIIIVLNLKTKEYAYLYFIGFMSVAVFSGFSIFMELFGLNFQYNSPIIYIITMASLPMLLGIDYLAFYEQELLQEQMLRKSEFQNANTDGLTGAWNQRYLTAQLKNLNGSAIITMIDLDNFKKINDTYGHLTGDAALIHTTKVIQSFMDSSDVLCRYGGDEFVILSHDKHINEHLKAMSNMCSTISNTPFINGNESITITLSVGIYNWDGSTTSNEALIKADQALYQSKQHGKNQVNLYAASL